MRQTVTTPTKATRSVIFLKSKTPKADSVARAALRGAGIAILEERDGGSVFPSVYVGGLTYVGLANIGRFIRLGQC